MRSSRDCEFKIAYGEHLEDGEVRRIIENRDFSLDFSVKAGEWELRQYFLRIAGRYLQLISQGDVELREIGVEQYLYPLTEIPRELAPEDRRIYDTCIRTLRLSMNHHYEDCPWREQALYVLDGRNQMLCGYYAFREHSFQRENLLMMSKGVREDGFLELTFPAKDTPSIPFFSIMYAVAVQEYVKHTGDLSILDEVMPRIERIMKGAADRIDRNGLIGDFEPPYWNFYEWIDGSDGYPIENNGIPDRLKYHLILNCAFVYAGERYRELCALRGIDCDLDTDSVRRAIESTFLDGDTGLFRNRPEGEDRSQLGNAFALLIGLGDERTVRAVKDSSGLAPATLSMIGYVYDALLNADPVSNKAFVLGDIRRRYNAMLDKGATSFWETEEGASAFDGAGSLCHGWSAMPVYYYGICCD